ncbi:MAG: tRNA (adenosine(37)-N6)-dimethylallyltransferase MiaA [Candidatus Omnitrophica bacterium]|nr:tRNA (adenosine(37)-N6)-dimethylallyltransferase MiaA [Candidatus Omnitrophota bacterium]
MQAIPRAYPRKNKIIFLVGPTASGKTKISISLAKKIGAEIISCDSMQVYKGMDIGTQKPPPALRKKIPHHMIDILAPDKEFSAADFRRRALRLIKQIHKRGKVPLFVGGTGLYMKALIDGLFPSPPKNERLRRKLYKIKDLHAKLEKIDPQAAEKIHPNDRKKLVRALEIYYTAKKTKSELKPKTKPLSDKYSIKIIGIPRPRHELYDRINRRVEKMFEDGFLDEARGILKKKLSMTAAQAIGYREAAEYFKNNIKTLEGLKEEIKKNTRHYAKRQLTWFKADKRIKWKRYY